MACSTRADPGAGLGQTLDRTLAPATNIVGDTFWHSRPVNVLAAAAPTPDWRLALVLVAMVALAVTASVVGQLGVGRDHVTAATRALVQLAIVSVLIAAMLQSVWWSLAFVLLMYAVATVTCVRRLGVPLPQTPWIALTIVAGALPVIGLSLGSGVVPFNGAGIIPVAGIVIGGVMTASTLTGRRASDELAGQFGSYEAAVALGLTQVDAAYVIIQASAREGLTPGLDQTRTVGLVTLPGAFIGVLLGGGTPLEAGAAQILVLLGLMAGQAIAATVLLRLIATGRVVRTDLMGVYPR
jgi:putative ABC transport system permease protein